MIQAESVPQILFGAGNIAQPSVHAGLVFRDQQTALEM
jgi:hypothetical protein